LVEGTYYITVSASYNSGAKTDS
jgi:hypothetical protein